MGKQQSKSLSPVAKAKKLIVAHQSDIIKVLPKHINPMVMMQGLFAAIDRNPKIAECTQISFLSACYEASQLGLVPHSALGHGSLIPYKGKVRFIPEYRGYIHMAKNTGKVSAVWARERYGDEKFEVFEGTRHELVHVPDMGRKGSDPSKILHVYAVIRYNDGSYNFDWMTKADVDKVREKSPNKNGEAWKFSYVEMAKKTIIRRLMKLEDLSPQINRMVTMDEMFDAGMPMSSTRDFDAEMFDVPAEVLEGEIENEVKEQEAGNRVDSSDAKKEQNDNRMEEATDSISKKIKGKKAAKPAKPATPAENPAPRKY